MYRIDRKSLEKIYKSYVWPILEYGDIMFSNMSEEHYFLIEIVNTMAGKAVLCVTVGDSTSIIYN